MTTSKVEALEVADEVFAVSFKEGIRKVAKAEWIDVMKETVDALGKDFIADERNRKRHSTIAVKAPIHLP